MNTDVKDILGKIKINDPTSIMALGGLVIATVAVILVLTGAISTFVQQRSLRAEYSTVNDAIDSMMSIQQDTPASLEARIAESQGRLDELLAVFPTEPDVTDEINRYYQYATYYGAQLVSVESTGKVPLAEDSPVSVESYSLTLSGQVNDLLSFVKHVADGAIDTVVITNVTIVPADPSQATVQLQVYYVPPREGDAAALPSGAPTAIPLLTPEVTPATP